MNENQVPTPQEALQILDRATSQFQGTRIDHVKIQQSLEVLMGVVANANTDGDADAVPDVQDESVKNTESEESKASDVETPSQDPS